MAIRTAILRSLKLKHGAFKSLQLENRPSDLPPWKGRGRLCHVRCKLGELDRTFSLAYNATPTVLMLRAG